MTTTTSMAPTDLLTATEQVELIEEHTFRCGVLIARSDPGTGRASLLAALHRAAYSRLYLGLERETMDPPDRRLSTAREDPAFVAGLRQADGGRQRWECGWRREPSSSDSLVVTSLLDGVRVRCAPGQVRPIDARPGQEVEVAFPTERRFVSPGFYLTVGLAGNGTGSAVRPRGEVLRWYLNVPAASAGPLLRPLIERLDEARIAFTVKTLNDPAQHPRPDAVVLYTDRSLAHAVSPVLQASLAASGVALRDPVPAFTRRLASGVAIADEPTCRRPALSFGQHRSLLLVRGVLAAGVGADLASRWAAVSAEFTAAGLDPSRPHLGPANSELSFGRGGWWQ
jgi:hypothetical protein